MNRRRALFSLASLACALVTIAAACAREGTDAPAGDDAAPPPGVDDGAPAGDLDVALVPVLQDDGGDPQGDAAAADADPSCVRTPPSLRCGLHPQCGCLPSETCDIADVDGGVECVPAGTFARGARCTSTVGCARGLICMLGTCHELCAGDGQSCGDDDAGTCAQVTAQGGAPLPNAVVCQIACDLRDANACGGSNAAGVAACQHLGDGKTDCLRGGTATEGTSCAGDVLCGPGLACVTIGQGGPTCKAWCRVGTADCGAKTCVAFASDKPIVRGVEHGVCN